MIKRSCFFLVSLLFLLHGSVEGKNHACFLEAKSKLEQIEIDLRIAESDLEIVRLLMACQKVLRRYLEDCQTEDFAKELSQLTPIIKKIGLRSNLFYYRFRPYKFSQAFRVQDENGHIVVFTNTYRSDCPLSEQEKSQLFFLEMKSYEKWGEHQKLTLTSDTLREIEPDVTYNFVVTSDRLVHFAKDETDNRIFLTTESGVSIKRIRSPNHTILAGNQPVLTCGTFRLWQVEDRQLIFVSNDSGHFRPDYESLEIFKQHLIELDFVPDQIICLAVQVDFASLLEEVARRQAYRQQAPLCDQKTK